MTISLALVLLTILTFSLEPCNGLCPNMYDSGKVNVTIGLRAFYEPKFPRYNIDDIVKFHCPKNYHFERPEWRKNTFVWLKCTELYGWPQSWPKCRGKFENVQCFNEYMYTAKFNKSWLNETPNRKHALYDPVQQKYKHLTTLRFRCPKGMNFIGAKGLPVMQSICGSNWDWSWEWPMCKGQTCSPYRLPDGITGTEDRRFNPGTKINISCWQGYHLWGKNTSTCLPDLSWSGFPRECVKEGKYKRNCQQSGGIFQKLHGDKLSCRKRVFKNYEQEESKKTKRIALASAIPLSALFVIFLTLSCVYVHRLRRRHAMMAVAIRYQNEDQALQMFLPSYEDAEKSKPTTPPPSFQESQEDAFILPGQRSASSSSGVGMNSLRRPPASPPVYEE